jgi:hypothetical protein
MLVSIGRGPLAKDWDKSAQVYMCCYKLVTFEFKKALVGGTVEKFMEKVGWLLCC